MAGEQTLSDFFTSELTENEMQVGLIVRYMEDEQPVTILLNDFLTDDEVNDLTDLTSGIVERIADEDGGPEAES